MVDIHGDHSTFNMDVELWGKSKDYLNESIQSMQEEEVKSESCDYVSQLNNNSNSNSNKMTKLELTSWTIFKQCDDQISYYKHIYRCSLSQEQRSNSYYLSCFVLNRPCKEAANPVLFFVSRSFFFVFFFLFLCLKAQISSRIYDFAATHYGIIFKLSFFFI
jgi:hypothetical protein